MLEMLRNVLDILQRNKTFRAQLDATTGRARSIRTCAACPIFASLTKDFIDHLRDRVELLRFSPGQVICRQGDPADSFYLVRIGFVKVSEEHPGGELVLAYLGARRLFRRDRPAQRQPAHRDLHRARPRRSRADLGRRLPTDAERFPDVRQSLEAMAHERAGRKPPPHRPNRRTFRSTSSSPRA